MLKKIDVGFDTNVRVVEHVFEHGRVTAGRDALVRVIEVVVVPSESNRDASDDRGRKLCRIAVPLFGRISTDEDFVKLVANLANDPLLEIFCLVAWLA